MPDSKTLAAYVLSTATFLGPVAYILFAFYEQGRLGYFGAPIDFMQISSFGILPVVKTVYPWMLVTFLVSSLLSGVRFSAPGQQVVLVACAFTYVSLVLLYVSLTPTWKWVFGVSAFLGVLVLIFKDRHTPDFGNEVPKAKSDPQHISVTHFKAIKRYVLVLMGIAIFAVIFSALGKREAATQESYWLSEDGVVLGFYGEQVLIADRSGYEVGPRFRFTELKSLKGSLNLLRIGPLKATPMWSEQMPES